MRNKIIYSLMLINTACSPIQEVPLEGISSNISQMKTFKLEEGTIAYEDTMTKESPVILCIPGMGDTRGQFRLLAPKLAAYGFRVIVVDPRGQGDSDATFKQYSASSVGNDIIKLISHLNIDVFLVGNSSGGASAAWVASQIPQRVKGVIFLNAFLRDHPLSLLNQLMLTVALRDPWGSSVWVNYYKDLFIQHPPEDQEKYLQALQQSLNKKGHIHALREMAFASKADVKAQLTKIEAPILAIGGSKDPDFKDPEDELNWILSVVSGKKAMIQGAGHYPHLEYPDQVSTLINSFITKR